MPEGAYGPSWGYVARRGPEHTLPGRPGVSSCIGGLRNLSVQGPHVNKYLECGTEDTNTVTFEDGGDSWNKRRLDCKLDAKVPRMFCWMPSDISSLLLHDVAAGIWGR